ncbi:putative methyltransferase [Corynebacterium kutscheri]|uniref:Release factor glutamine methyltransferase n=1 Tax=Corynebacterium kutscheri TaxID=35755 RepID=A0AB38VXK6_9CORY|nr:peptide chain release factor N(5)-glutamine methyltransferase [Corynebacterium kutscheri]VEH08923.1 putative methyltransferase [Corynebacterium kutscheri]VEH80053.1 putative methyltransferase [Corynebacterium kutscheri]
MLFHALREAEATLAQAGVASPRYDTHAIAAHVLGVAPLEITFHMRDEVPAEFFEYIKLRAQRVPLQHILEEAYFGPLRFSVGPGVFVPRPETEVLAQWAEKELEKKFSEGENDLICVDLCTGSGALAAYIKNAHPKTRVYAVELSNIAAEYARKNFAAAGLNISLTRQDASLATTLAELNGTVDLLITNPPYVPERSEKELEPEVSFDPHMAVFSGEDGMQLIPKLIIRSAALLKPGGQIGIEHDDTTSAAVIAAFEDTGLFRDIRTMADLTGRNRFVLATRRS